MAYINTSEYKDKPTKHSTLSSESKSHQLEKELEEKSAVVTRLDGVEKEAGSLRQQLSEAKSQLETTNRTLAKEQGKNKSAAQHKQVHVSFW